MGNCVKIVCEYNMSLLLYVFTISVCTLVCPVFFLNISSWTGLWFYRDEINIFESYIHMMNHIYSNKKKYVWNTSRPLFNKRTPLYGYRNPQYKPKDDLATVSDLLMATPIIMFRNPIIDLRRSGDRLRFVMVIPIPMCRNLIINDISIPIYRNPIINLIRSDDRLILRVGIPIPIRRRLRVLEQTINKHSTYRVHNSWDVLVCAFFNSSLWRW